MILRMTSTLRGMAPNSEDLCAGWDLWKRQQHRSGWQRVVRRKLALGSRPLALAGRRPVSAAALSLEMSTGLDR
jgi:hypothetical protein